MLFLNNHRYLLTNNESISIVRYMEVEMKNNFDVYCLIVSIIIVVISFNKSIFADSGIKHKNCIEEAVEQTLAIKSLPKKNTF